MFRVPPMATALIAACGWRSAYAMLGLLGLIAMVKSTGSCNLG